MLGRITPLGGNDFYYQCGSSGEYNNTMAPGLYRFDAESNSCSMLGNASEISGIALPKSLHNIIGVSSFNIENNKFIAFGTPSSNGSTLTVAEITSSGERQFKEAKKLWTINSTGFSHNPDSYLPMCQTAAWPFTMFFPTALQALTPHVMTTMAEIHIYLDEPCLPVQIKEYAKYSIRQGAA